MPKNLIILISILVVAAIASLARPGAIARFPSEKEVEKMIPTQVGSFVSDAGPEGPGYSYKMEEATYNTLRPLGIIARIYRDGPAIFDAVVIPAERTSSIHDPRDCFTRQGWDIVDIGSIDVPTRAMGEVPFRLMQMRSTEGAGNRLALFSYRGPTKFYNVVRDLQQAQLNYALKTLKSEHVIAYRFIDMTQRATKEDLVAFAAKFLDATHGRGNGFLR